MLRAHDEEPGHTRRPAAPAPAPLVDERLAALLRMQHAAGNHAVARMLAASRTGVGPRGALQRAAVEGSVTETGQKHHPTYRFRFPGEEDARAHDLDAWHTGKRTVGGPAHAATLTRRQILDVIDAWDCTSSIVGPISDRLVGASTWPAATGNRIQEGTVTAATHTVHDPLTQTEDGKVFAMHFLALKHNMARRQADIRADLPQAITIKKSTKVPKRTPKPDRYTLTWTNLLKAARELLKPLLVQRTAPPDWQDQVMLVHDALFAGQAGDASVEHLRTIGLLYRQSGKTAYRNKHGETDTTRGWQYEVKKVEPNLDIAFGINHLSIAIYYEWRAVWEILQRAQAPAAQANAAPQQAPAAALPFVIPAAAQQPARADQQPVEDGNESDTEPIDQDALVGL